MEEGAVDRMVRVVPHPQGIFDGVRRRGDLRRRNNHNAVRILRALVMPTNELLDHLFGVRIDERVSIAGNCKISGGLFEILPDGNADPPYRRYSKGPVHIEKNCLVASGAIILDDVTVGEGTLVGAGSVVSMNLPPNSISAIRPPVLLKNPRLKGA